MRRSLPVCLSALLTLSCATSVTAWKSPDAGQRSFKNLAVFVITPDSSVRKTSERVFMQNAANSETKVTPSHTFVPDDMLKDKEGVVAKLKQAGHDGAVVFRLIALDEKQSDVIAPIGYSTYSYYGGFSSYWGYYAVPVYTATFSGKQQIVQIETTLYSVEDGKLIWASQLKLKNPDSTLDVIEETCKRATDGMRGEKLIR